MDYNYSLSEPSNVRARQAFVIDYFIEFIGIDYLLCIKLMPCTLLVIAVTKMTAATDEYHKRQR